MNICSCPLRLKVSLLWLLARRSSIWLVLSLGYSWRQTQRESPQRWQTVCQEWAPGDKQFISSASGDEKLYNKLQLFPTLAVNKEAYVLRGWVHGLLFYGFSPRAIIQTTTSKVYTSCPLIDGYKLKKKSIIYLFQNGNFVYLCWLVPFHSCSFYITVMQSTRNSLIGWVFIQSLFRICPGNQKMYIVIMSFCSHLEHSCFSCIYNNF